MAQTRATNDLRGVSEAALRELLESHGDIPTMRITAALLVVEGCPKSTIASALGVSLKTVYNWLERFTNRPVDKAPFDEPRPGAPGKLDPNQREALYEALASRPDQTGYDARGWTPDLVNRFIREEFDIEYSRRHVRRLMHEASLD